jgi:lipopolysaccharide exporter
MSEARLTGGHAVRGVLWAVLTQVLSKGSTVLATLVLARLLVPSDFGLFAVGLLVINYLDRVKDVGVGAALVYRRETWARLATTGLPLSIVTTAVLAGLAYLAAPLAGSFFEEPRAADLVRALSVALLLSGLAVVPESRLRRELDFRRRLVPEAAVALVKGVVSIVLALGGLGVWALVWGQLAGTAVQCLLYWVLCDWRPRLGWDRDDARRLLRYGIPSAGVAVFAVVLENLDYLVIGRRMSSAELGYYTMAFRMPELVVIGLCLVVSQVLFPLFSRFQDDPDRMRDTYLRAVRNISLVTVPAALLFAVLAEEIVLVLYSARWEPAIPVLRVLALYSLAFALSFHAGDVYKATGRPGLLNTLAVVELLLLAPVLWVAAGHTITTVAVGLLGVTAVMSAVKFVVVGRILRLPLPRLLGGMVPAALTTAPAVLVVQGLQPVLGTLSPQLRLVLLVAAGAGVFVGTVRLCLPGLSGEVMAYVRGRGEMVQR